MSRLLTRPVAWDGSAAGRATRPPRSVLREQVTNRGFRVADQYLMRRVTWASSSSPSHPRTPWVLPRWLQGRLARSTAVRFFAVLSRARALRAITQSAPARPRPEEHRETNRRHPQRKREIMGLMAVAATVSKDRIQPVGGLRLIAARSRQCCQTGLCDRLSSLPLPKRAPQRIRSLPGPHQRACGF